jgi:hypothetical protein
MMMAAIMLLVGTPACKKKEVAPCPDRYAAATPEQKKATLECACTGKETGSVWGDGVYTTDSSVCRAAIHAGAVPAAGGVAKAQAAPGCAAYSGAERHGISSNRWGRFDTSFFFPGFGSATCPPAPPPSPFGQALGEALGGAAKAASGAVKDALGQALGKAAEAVAGALKGAVGTPAPAKPGDCPSRFQDAPAAGAGAEQSCNCDPQAVGSVWGTGVYTGDSSICRAAWHAGAIPATGGRVTFKAAAGCKTYRGTEANGVTTSGWGPYQQSFYFVGKGDGRCLE